MLREYAVDPELLGRFGPAWVLMEQFGIPHGRIIASCPSNWPRLVHDAMATADCQGMEKKALTERLNRLKKCVVSLKPNRDFSGASWVRTIERLNQAEQFDAILTESELEGSNVLRVIDASSSNPLWRISNHPIPRTAEAVATCVGPLGQISKEIVLVDPYFSTDPPAIRSLRAILNACCATTRTFRRFEIHGSEKLGDLALFLSQIEKAFDGYEIISRLAIFKWRSKAGGDTMHPRYFLTELGGIRFDYGLVAGKPGQTTDVQLLNEDIYERRWAEYRRESTAFELVDSVGFHDVCDLDMTAI